MKLTHDELINLVMASFEAERTHDTAGGKALLHPDFEVVDAWIGSNDELFPRYRAKDMSDSVDEVYRIVGREYSFHTVVANAEQQTVMVEFVESYPDPKTGQVYRTPQVAICQIKDGKLWRTRHYADPRLSYLRLSTDQTGSLFD